MSVTVSRILHAGYVFKSASTAIVFDPLLENPFSVNCHAFPSVEFDLNAVKKQIWNAVFISHYHDDHLSLESLQYFDRATPIYLFSEHPVFFELLRTLGFTAVERLHLNVPVTVGDFTITPRRALDADVDSLFHIQCQDINILNVVDSWIDDDTLALLKTTSWDLVLWPFQTMSELEVLSPKSIHSISTELPHEWTEQLQTLKPKAIVPSSCQFQMEQWSWYNSVFFPISYDTFYKTLARIAPLCTVYRLDPGESLKLDKGTLSPAPPLSWVIPTSPVTVDYSFDATTRPPTTASIACHFPALTFEEDAAIELFCTKTLIDSFNALPERELGTSTPLNWRLTLYDHTGSSQTYHYTISASGITQTQQLALVNWTTEIAKAKLYGALTNGESLTSIYIRINEHIDETEYLGEDCDVLNDPLLRVLYSRSIASYQEAQLRRLKRPRRQ